MASNSLIRCVMLLALLGVAVAVKSPNELAQDAVSAYLGGLQNTKVPKVAGAGSGGSGDGSLTPDPAAVAEEEGAMSAGAVVLSRLGEAERKAVTAYLGGLQNMKVPKDAGAGSGGSGDGSPIPATAAVAKEEGAQVGAGAVILSRQGEEQRNPASTPDAGAVSVGSGDNSRIPAPAAVAKKGRGVSKARRAMMEDRDPMSESALLEIVKIAQRVPKSLPGKEE